jgi:hypothetical protein
MLGSPDSRLTPFSLREALHTTIAAFAMGNVAPLAERAPISEKNGCVNGPSFSYTLTHCSYHCEDLRIYADSGGKSAEHMRFPLPSYPG